MAWNLGPLRRTHKRGRGTGGCRRQEQPERDVHVDPVDTGGCNLPDPLHINLAPCRGVGTDPDILVTLGDPKCGASTEDGRLT